MKPFLIFSLSVLLSGTLFGQTSQCLYVPYLDKESQSNVIVTVESAGEPCPPEYTNTLSNTNLFTPEEQKMISEVFVKYKNVTTNSGPPGTVLTNFYKTNRIVKAIDRTVEIEDWVSEFRYTNSNAQEQITLGHGGLLARFQNRSGDGYSVSFDETGDGTMVRFIEKRNNLAYGVLAAVEDMQPQGSDWDFRCANFSMNSPLTEYRQYTNGMVLGKFLMWDPRHHNNLFLAADFKEPYDFEKHRIDLNLLIRHR